MGVKHTKIIDIAELFSNPNEGVKPFWKILQENLRLRNAKPASNLSAADRARFCMELLKN